jgi:hypothetical protein
MRFFCIGLWLWPFYFAADLLAQVVAPDGHSLPHYPYSLAERKFKFAAPHDSTTIALLDSFIIANSDTLRRGQYILQRGHNYRLDYRSAKLEWLQRQNAADPVALTDTLVLTYRFLPLSLPRQLALFRLSRPAENDSLLSPRNLMVAIQNDNSSSTRANIGANLAKSGSITRGVSIGTDQGLKVDSGLRMQIAGKITDKMEVVAALTDQNTPIQPEGNTQTLNEIDKVFVQLKSERFNATLGDFQIEYGGSEFSRYSRKLQGAQVKLGNEETEETQRPTFEMQLSAAVSDGKFTVNEFLGIEGKQGPYQLQGDRGQIDILVLAGTERVWVDGQLLTRGENNDYVIEYSNGQITFTRKRLITADSRITVDFQFSDERFRRNLYSAQGVVAGFNDKVKWQTTLIREGDDQDHPLAFTLSDSDRVALAAAGDSLAFRNGARFVGAGKGTYIDSAGVFIRKDSGDYVVAFSDVGDGRGDYAYRGFNHFIYIGKNKGRYLPIVLLAPAVRQEVIDTRLELTPWQGVSLINEIAVSQLDRNLYSNRDDDDNTGRALLSTLQIEPQSLRLGRAALGQFGLQVRYRHRGARYRDIDRADVVEFNRRWNLQNPETATGEEIVESSVNYSPFAGWNWRGGYGRLNRGVSSQRWEAGMDFKRAKLPELQYQIENISRKEMPAAQLQNSIARSEWLRQRGAITYSFWKIKPQLGYEGEDRKEVLADTSAEVVPLGFRFHSYIAGLDAQILSRIKISTMFNQRQDETRTNQGLVPKSTSHTQSYALTLERWRALAADFSFIHRERNFADTPQDARTDLADLRVRFSPFRHAMDSDWQYQITRTQVSQRERVFFKVRQGEGNYRFDEKLNAYVPDPIGDYVLRVIETEDFAPVIELRARSSVRINFASVFRTASSKSWKRYLMPFSTDTFIRLEEKTQEPREWEIYKLNLRHFQNDSTTIFGVQSLRQDIHLWENRRERSLRYRLTALRERNRQFLNEEGFRRQQLRHELRITLALTPKLSSQTEIILNREDKTFDKSVRQGVPGRVTSERNLWLRNRSGNVELSYRPRPVLELALAAGASFDEDRANAPNTRARAVSIKPRSTYSFRGKGRISGAIEWTKVSAEPENRILPYELANGNRPGQTHRWNFALEYRVSTNVNFSASYFGRREPERPNTFHLAKVEMRAFF